MGEGGGGFSEEQMKLEYTPTWIVAGVCSVIVLISLVVERLLHRLGKVGFFSPTLFIYLFIFLSNRCCCSSVFGLFLV